MPSPPAMESFALATASCAVIVAIVRLLGSERLIEPRVSLSVLSTATFEGRKRLHLGCTAAALLVTSERWGLRRHDEEGRKVRRQFAARRPPRCPSLVKLRRTHVEQF